MRRLPLAVFAAIILAFTGVTASTAAPVPPATVSPVITAAPTTTRVCGTGGYAYETDSFYTTRRWNGEQYANTITWGGNRSVKSGSQTYVHQLESIRLRFDGRNLLYTRFTNSKATPETYWLNTSKVKLTFTTKITKKSTGQRWFRACTITF